VKTEPAFPVVGQWYGDKLGGQLTHGMTLRDYFAAKALMGMMVSRNPNSPRFNPEDDAAYVYAVADAMLHARENK
jgi:hypothetical protein